jgi:hypothetical protein
LSILVMPAIDSVLSVHPLGEPVHVLQEALPVDTMGNRYHVEWDPHSPVTAFGHLVFFFQFLATGQLWSEFVRGCPLVYTSNNAPKVGDVLGTWLLTTLAGASRYAHTTALIGDKVNPPALGMDKVVSEDSLRRSFQECDGAAVESWQANTLVNTCRPFLKVPWICDLDVTVKTLYGKQEGAEVGYNPHKKGRPSHAYHTLFIRHARLALDVFVQPGNRHEPVHGREHVWRVLDSLPADEKPFLICGDANYGTNDYLVEAEQRNLKYLFRMRANPAIKTLIQQLDRVGKWQRFDDLYSYQEAVLKIGKWDKPRRLIFIAKKVRESRKQEDTPLLDHANLSVMREPAYEFAVLVTNIDESAHACVELYHKRGDMENNYDELKNHWGWGGFMTKDLLRCQVAARFNAIFFNWWNLFTRCAEPRRPRESVTSRPLLLHAVGQIVKSGRQTTLRLTSSHGEREQAQSLLTRLSLFLSGVANTAEQLTSAERWARICAPIIAAFTGNRAVAVLPSG